MFAPVARAEFFGKSQAHVLKLNLAVLRWRFRLLIAGGGRLGFT